MRYCVQPGNANAPETVMFGADSGCDEFEQRVLRFTGAGEARTNPHDDEVLFVLAGRGRATVAAEPVELTAGTAVYAGSGTTWRVEEADGLEVLSVLVRAPEPGAASHAVVRLDDAEAAGATAGRQFQLLATPELGCASVTQFVGTIPVGRAPDHFHTYDEVVYVLDGTGELHIGGDSAPLAAGTCVHLPARLVHSLENLGPDAMHVLGVFRPAGSPAEAYYPDGTLAVVRQEA